MNNEIAIESIMEKAIVCDVIDINTTDGNGKYFNSSKEKYCIVIADDRLLVYCSDTRWVWSWPMSNIYNLSFHLAKEEKDDNHSM